MMKRIIGVIMAAGVASTQLAGAIEYKQNVISGSGGTSRSFVQTFSSHTSKGGTNVTKFTSKLPGNTFHFRGGDWADPFGRQTLEQRIRHAEQKLHKLYFMRDVCRVLEDEITITFEKKDIREVMKQVSQIKGVELPFEVPEGDFVVEKSDVSGMPLDDFLNSVASVAGLTLQYAPDKLMFVKEE